MLKFSVIIPSYNSAKFIGRAIDSILVQDYPDFECIVMDGGSTDGTLDILKGYGDRITWKTGRDRGQSDAINKGFEISTGDIIAELDADDTYEKGCFQKVASYLEKNPGNQWVYGRCRVINDDGREMWKPVTWLKTVLQKRYSYNKLLLVDFIPQPAVFWRRGLIQEMGFFDINEHLVMDYEHLLRIGKKYRPGFIDDYLASWRIHTCSKSSMNSARRAREGLDAVKRYTDSRVMVGLHYLTYFGIVLIYSTSKLMARLRLGG